MADDIQLATLPHELAVADAELREILEKELARIGIPGSIHRLHTTFSQDVPRATKWYVMEVFRIEGGRGEFLRRSMVLRAMTAEGTEFADAWADLKESVVRWHDRLKQYYPGESIERCGRQIPVNVSCIASFSGRPEAVMVLEVFLRSVEILLGRLWWARVFVKKLRRMRRAAEAVRQEAKRSETEGSRLLLLWGCDLSPDGFDNNLLAFLETCHDPDLERLFSQLIPKTTLERMNRARASMTAWIRSNGAIAPRKQASKKKPQKRGNKAAGTRQVDQIVQFITDKPDLADKPDAWLANHLKIDRSVFSKPENKVSIEVARERARRNIVNPVTGYGSPGDYDSFDDEYGTSRLQHEAWKDRQLDEMDEGN